MFRDLTGGYAINVTKAPLDDTSKTSLVVDDLHALPEAIKALVERGYDLSATAEALREAEEAQCKRKEDEKRRKLDIIEAIEQVRARAKQERRFVVAWYDEEVSAIRTKRGIAYPDRSTLCLDVPGRLKSAYGDEAELRADIYCAYPKTMNIIFSFLD